MLRLQKQSTQESLLLFQKQNPKAKINYHSVAIGIKGPINPNILSYAIRQVLSRHEILRAKITNGSLNLLEINPKPPFEQEVLHIIDASKLKGKLSTHEIVETLKLLKREDFIEPFNLEHGPLYRFGLIKTNVKEYQFLVLINQLIIDRYSIDIILNDLSSYYNEALDELIPKLPPLPSLIESNVSIDESAREDRLNYWQEKLKNFTTLNLITETTKNFVESPPGNRLRFKLKKELIEQIKNNPNLFPKFSMNQIILAACYSLLYRYSGENDICLGITSDLGNAHSVPLRVTFKDVSTFLEMLTEVKTNMSEALQNQLPLNYIFQEALSPAARMAQQTASPFKIMVAVNSKQPALALKNIETSHAIELDFGVCEFPYFGIHLDELDDVYEGYVTYNTSLFKEPRISRFVGHLTNTLQVMSTHPEQSIDAYPLLTNEELDLINLLNNTEQAPKFSGYITDFLHAQYESNDEFIRFHYEDGHTSMLSYKEFDILTTKLANYLVALDLKPQMSVAISIERSLNVVIAIFGALKAGALFVPLETEDSELLSLKIKNIQPDFALCDAKTKSFFSSAVKVIDLTDKETLNHINKTDETYVSRVASPRQAAYMMPTSGTTGTPKIPILPHEGFVNLLNDLYSKLKMKEILLGTALPTFDAFLYDYLVALATQGAVHFVFEKGRTALDVNEKVIADFKINSLVSIPTFINLLNPNSPIKHLISMGATANNETLETWANADKDRLVENGYGHTETGICLSVHRFTSGSETTLIGTPIHNMKVFILDEHLALCPFDVRGEICVSGPGLALGYLNNPELTEAKFVTAIYDPSCQMFKRCANDTEGAIRFYTTGDYGSYTLVNNKACINFIGRKDRQIKLHGLRIELDEIEILLQSHYLVKEAVVLPNGDHSGLNAFIVPTTDGITFAEFNKQLQDFLSHTLLPAAAHPRRTILLSSLPITKNGKIDMQALAQKLPEASIILNEKLTSLQQQIRHIWADVLAKSEQQVSIHSTFQELGGDSILLARLESALNTSLKLTQHAGINILSPHMTIKSLGEKLKSFLHTASPAAPIDSYRKNHPIFFKKSTSKLPPNESSSDDTDSLDSPGETIHFPPMSHSSGNPK